MRRTHSAGGVVVGPNRQILVIHQDQKTWSLPKGHLDPGETAEQAARREIGEESGITDLKLIKPLGNYERYQIGLDGQDNLEELKQITIYLFVTNQLEVKPSKVGDADPIWIKPKEVENRLTHPKDQAFFRSILPDIRHALNKSVK